MGVATDLTGLPRAYAVPESAADSRSDSVTAGHVTTNPGHSPFQPKSTVPTLAFMADGLTRLLHFIEHGHHLFMHLIDGL